MAFYRNGAAGDSVGEGDVGTELGVCAYFVYPCTIVPYLQVDGYCNAIAAYDLHGVVGLDAGASRVFHFLDYIAVAVEDACHELEVLAGWSFHVERYICDAVLVERVIFQSIGVPSAVCGDGCLLRCAGTGGYSLVEFRIGGGVVIMDSEGGLIDYYISEEDPMISIVMGADRLYNMGLVIKDGVRKKVIIEDGYVLKPRKYRNGKERE